MERTAIKWRLEVKHQIDSTQHVTHLRRKKTKIKIKNKNITNNNNNKKKMKWNKDQGFISWLGSFTIRYKAAYMKLYWSVILRFVLMLIYKFSKGRTGQKTCSIFCINIWQLIKSCPTPVFGTIGILNRAICNFSGPGSPGIIGKEILWAFRSSLRIWFSAQSA